MAKFELEDALKDFEAAETFWREPYERGEADVKFALGLGQWPDNIRNEREKEGRPCLTENRTLPFVNQVINQIRQSRPSIVPKPVDDKADVEVADIIRGIIKNVETSCDADSVYDTAARNSVMGSVGWIRVVTDYADTDTFDQEIRLERVQNPFSCYLDPNHQRQDGSDAKFGFIFTDMDKEEFEEAYPGAKSEGFSRKGWHGDKTVRIVECFYKEDEDKELVEYQIQTLKGIVKGSAYREDMPLGAEELRSRKVEVCKIKYAKITELDVLEEGEFAGKYIPLVPVYGFETCVDGKRTFYSLIHQAKDPQRMLNYWRSASAEIVALQPKAPYVGLVGQFKSYVHQWRNANRQNLPFLEADPVYDVNGNPLPILPQRQPPPTSSGTLMQEAMGAADAIKASLGMYDASLGNQTNDISGKAIISRQMQGDNATFHFIDNLAVSIRHVGRIIIGLIPLIYSQRRILRIMGDDGSETVVPLNTPVIKQGKTYRQPVDGEVGKVIKLDAGKYDVVVEVGPSYATRREELANMLVELSRIKPEIMDVAGDIMVRSIDVPGSEEIAKRLRAVMPAELLADDVEAARVQKLTQALTDLQQRLQQTEDALLAKNNDASFKNELEAKKVQLDAKKLEIDAAKTMAEIKKIESEIGQNAGEAIGAVAQALKELQARYDDIEGAMQVLLSAKEEEGTAVPEAAA